MYHREAATLEQPGRAKLTDSAASDPPGGGGKAGIVLEARQGMVDRGADLAWLSQCATAAARRPS